MKELDQRVLLACLRLNPNAYGVSIGDEILRRFGKEYSPGSIWAAIERLEDKGCLIRRDGEARPERGGRKRVYFTLSEVGKGEVDEIIDASIDEADIA